MTETAPETSGLADSDRKLEVALLLLRVGVAIVMIPWSIDKLVDPGHAAAIFQGFYGLEGVGTTVILVLGLAQLAVVLAFLAGILKTWTYGLVLVMHAMSTLSSWQQYLDWSLLFYAAWPMLAACIVLFMFRKEDRLWAVTGKWG